MPRFQQIAQNIDLASGLLARLDDLSSLITNNYNAIQVLETQVNGLQAQITTLNGQVSTINTTLTSLQSQINTINSRLAAAGIP